MLVCTKSIDAFRSGCLYKLLSFNISQVRSDKWKVVFQFSSNMTHTVFVKTDRKNPVNEMVIYQIIPFCNYKDWGAASTWYINILKQLEIPNE